MSEMHALTGAYAVDALDDLERVRFERHLAECPDCGAEVRTLRSTAGLLSQTVASAPSAALRSRVLAEIHTVRPLAPVPVPVAAVRSRARRFPRLVAAAVVAAVLVIGGAIAGGLRPGDGSQAPVAAVSTRVMDAPDARTQSVAIVGGARATLYHSQSVDRSVLVTDKLGEAPSGKVYELWYLSAKGAFVPAGLMTDGGHRTVVLHGKLGSAKGVGITVEPSSGSQHPTSAPIVMFKLSKSV